MGNGFGWWLQHTSPAMRFVKAYGIYYVFSTMVLDRRCGVCGVQFGCTSMCETSQEKKKWWCCLMGSSAGRDVILVGCAVLIFSVLDQIRFVELEKGNKYRTANGEEMWCDTCRKTQPRAIALDFKF